MSEHNYDLAIVGGGINGCGIARDAAGRGLKVLLLEQDDLASATSSWSSKLIHGGLRYLEQNEFRLVRESLQEREVLLKLAPHIIQPLEFILPHDSSMRPAWMVRLGLFMYDHIGGKISLPGSRGVSFPDQQYSAGLKSSIRQGFFYSDARVDDARLTVLNAVSAREHGAEIRTRTRVTGGKRVGDVWQIGMSNIDTGETSEARARGVVNAAGPWVKQLLDDAVHVPMTATVKLVKGSHIVVPRVHDQQHAYILQNDDKRVVFIIPLEEKLSLIGTTDVHVKSVAEGHQISKAEITYLIHAANQFLAKPLHEADVVWSYAGVRPLYDDGAANPSEITRDYVLKTDHQGGKLPLLSIFGGKITTYRRLAEHALEELSPYFPALSKAWTGDEPLPGGEFDTLPEAIDALAITHPSLPIDYLSRLVRRHGTRAEKLLKGTRAMSDLGELFGAGASLLSEREIDFCIREEWARKPDDILWRRTKCGLHMDEAERSRAATFIEARYLALV
ncbi:MAG: glycerol-3-phosphate dehydrogenase [Burkholderiales bacterium]|nr:glycerol-3-phosphate dehydrogenase [Burkholderiales bacterium]